MNANGRVASRTLGVSIINTMCNVLAEVKPNLLLFEFLRDFDSSRYLYNNLNILLKNYDLFNGQPS